MNRIILIGNGFDLAHGLKTSYQHFLENYWSYHFNIASEKVGQDYECEEFEIHRVPPQFNHVVNTSDFNGCISYLGNSFRIKNHLLFELSTKNCDLNWVDVENEYYQRLKKCRSQADGDRAVKRLNTELSQIQLLLEQYLKKQETKFFSSDRSAAGLSLQNIIKEKIYDNFNVKDFTEGSINHKVEMEFQNIIKTVTDLEDNNLTFAEIADDIDENTKRLIRALVDSKDKKAEIRRLLLSNQAINYFDLNPPNIMFLNFNYTSLENLYTSQEDRLPQERIMLKYNHIHGVLNSAENRIIFGFGDEMDDEYKALEELNNNDYLEKVKSIKYLETDNYKTLMEFVNSSTFQLFIFGHSCGNSDRTLLNTIFEHKNCSSIKVFYHQIDSLTDNYSDVIRNISRNFANKASMRDKVVNKMYCMPLAE